MDSINDTVSFKFKLDYIDVINKYLNKKNIKYNFSSGMHTFNYKYIGSILKNNSQYLFYQYIDEKILKIMLKHELYDDIKILNKLKHCNLYITRYVKNNYDEMTLDEFVFLYEISGESIFDLMDLICSRSDDNVEIVKLFHNDLQNIGQNDDCLDIYINSFYIACINCNFRIIDFLWIYTIEYIDNNMRINLCNDLLLSRKIDVIEYLLDRYFIKNFINKEFFTIMINDKNHEGLDLILRRHNDVLTFDFIFLHQKKIFYQAIALDDLKTVQILIDNEFPIKCRKKKAIKHAINSPFVKQYLELQ